jgi:quercetin dioxygenase-like cupin family protein
MQDVFVAAGLRTPFSRVDGALAASDAIDRSVLVVRAMEYPVKSYGTLTVMALLAALFAVTYVESAQVGTSRTELQRHDLSTPGREVIQVRVDLDRGAVAPRHRHPGEEIIYVLSGTWQYQVGSSASTTLGAGDVLFIPAGAVHSAKIVGDEDGSELATYIVEKGKPLVEIIN